MKKDIIRMDSHKLIYHPETVGRWLKGENIYPIELEVGLTNACNHRCIFCAVDYTGYQPVMLDQALLLNNLKDLSQKGLKSVIYAGEGEPLLHKGAPDIINQTKAYGMDAALSTNGVFFTPEVSRDCLKSLTWIRFSTAGIKEETFQKVQKGQPGDINKILYHMQEAVRVKRDQKADTTIGVQLLLLPDNKDELVEMAKELRNIGVDYFTIKPFSQHPQSEKIIQVDYSELLGLEEEVNALATDDFRVYFRAHTMEKLTCKRGYQQCLALPFMVYVDAKGNLWPCIVFMGKEEDKYGNLYEHSFIDIWEGRERKELVERFLKMDLEKNCREVCRLDEMNAYLDELVHPGAHVNFI
ncbi:MAG: radical SAM protein [Lachnospiraceae bacterium]